MPDHMTTFSYDGWRKTYVNKCATGLAPRIYILIKISTLSLHLAKSCLSPQNKRFHLLQRSDAELKKFLATDHVFGKFVLLRLYSSTTKMLSPSQQLVQEKPSHSGCLFCSGKMAYR